MRCVKVGLPQPSPAQASDDHGRCPPADSEVQGVAQDGCQCQNEHGDVDVEPVGCHDRAGEEKQGVPGQEWRNDQARLGKDDDGDCGQCPGAVGGNPVCQGLVEGQGGEGQCREHGVAPSAALVVRGVQVKAPARDQKLVLVLTRNWTFLTSAVAFNGKAMSM